MNFQFFHSNFLNLSTPIYLFISFEKEKKKKRSFNLSEYLENCPSCLRFRPGPKKPKAHKKASDRAHNFHEACRQKKPNNWWNGPRMTWKSTTGLRDGHSTRRRAQFLPTASKPLASTVGAPQRPSSPPTRSQALTPL